MMKTLLLLVAAPVLLPAASQASRKPNIIYIQADDLGYGDLSCYGQKKFKTPGIDRMAAEGTRYTQYYCGSTVCAPSRYSLLTGYHTGHAYIRGNAETPLREGEVNVARVLKGAGYATAVIGKYGLGLSDNSGRPDKQGFDYQFGHLDHRHAHRQYTDHLFRNSERIETDEKKDWSNDLFTKESFEFIRKNKDGPFFLYLNYTNPHAELWVPEDSLKEYRGKYPDKPWLNGQGDAPGAKGYRSQESPRAAFAAMVTRMDRDVGRILDLVRELKLEADTLVLYTSDNGPHREGGADPVFFESGGPLRGIKRDLYEGGVRVPMIAWWPGRVAAGAVSDQIWAHWDFLPTAAELAGVPAPAGIDGISMVPMLLGKEQRSHEYLYWEFYERGFDQAIRWGDWKGVRNGLESPLELYNLNGDLGEKTNVAGDHPEVVAKLEALMKGARTDSERWIPKKVKK